MNPVAINPEVLFQILYYLAILIFIIHAVVLAYHWYSFGADQKKSILGAVIHVVVGSLILLAMGVALLSM